MNKTLPTPRCIIDNVTTVQTLTVLTLNVHKGFTPFNRRFILPELREAVRATGADLVFLQEVTAATSSMPSATQPGRKRRSTSFWPTACGRSSPMVVTLCTPMATTAMPCCRNSPSASSTTGMYPSTAMSSVACSIAA